MLSPAMQGVILAIAKARQTFDRDGSEAGLVKVSLILLHFHKHGNLFSQNEGCVLCVKTYQASERKGPGGCFPT